MSRRCDVQRHCLCLQRRTITSWLPAFITSAVVPATRDHRHQQCEHRSHSGGGVHPRYTGGGRAAQGPGGRARGRTARGDGDVLAYVDADCRAPLQWLERVEQPFRPRASGRRRHRSLSFLRLGPASVGCSCVVYDCLVAPPTQRRWSQRGLPDRRHSLRWKLRGQRAALVARSAALTRSIDFHGEDTNLAAASSAMRHGSRLGHRCWVCTSARRYRAMGRGKVFRLYVRNFCVRDLLVIGRPTRPIWT